MDKELPLESLEYIRVRTPQNEQYYMGLKGTFATLLDSCCRKQALPGFYNSTLLAEALSEGESLNIQLAGEMTDEELLSCLDVAIRNIGGFPVDNSDRGDFFVEVTC